MGSTWKSVAGRTAVVVVFGLTACASPAPPAPAADGTDASGSPSVTTPSVPATPSASAAPPASVAPPPGAEVTAVRLSTGASSTTIRTEDGTGYRVERVVRRTDPGDAGPEPGPSYRLDGTTLVLQDCEQRDCWFVYTVTVPRGVSVGGRTGSGGTRMAGIGAVDLRGGSGEVEVGDVAGPVRVSSGSGGVRLASVTGDVEVDTGSGSVQGADLRGTRATIETGSGSIDLTFTGKQAVDASSDTGEIRLAVPAGRYRLEIEAGRGATVGPDVVDDPGAPTVIRARGTDRVSVTTATG